MEEITNVPVLAVAEVAGQPAETGADTPDELEEAIQTLVELAAKLAYERALAWSGQKDDPQPEDGNASFIRELIRQEDEIRSELPEFDLAKKMAESNAFRALILVGEPIGKALDYVEPERTRARAEEDVLERIRRRNLRPNSMGAGNRPAESSIDDRLDEEEMRRIDAQLKRGRKVYL